MIIRLASVLRLDDVFMHGRFVQLDGRMFSCTRDGEVRPRSPSTRSRGSRYSPRLRGGRERSGAYPLGASWSH